MARAGLKFGLWNALHTYKHYKDSWKKMMKRCMTTDFSWELRSGSAYSTVLLTMMPMVLTVPSQSTTLADAMRVCGSARKYEQIFEWAKMDPPSQNPWPF